MKIIKTIKTTTSQLIFEYLDNFKSLRYIDIENITRIEMTHDFEDFNTVKEVKKRNIKELEYLIISFIEYEKEKTEVFAINYLNEKELNEKLTEAVISAIETIENKNVKNTTFYEM